MAQNQQLTVRMDFRLRVPRSRFFLCPLNASRAENASLFGCWLNEITDRMPHQVDPVPQFKRRERRSERCQALGVGPSAK